jgi:hypothetical protein
MTPMHWLEHVLNPDPSDDMYLSCRTDRLVGTRVSFHTNNIGKPVIKLWSHWNENFLLSHTYHCL